jgi:DNA repair exonuclease SbcCD ATPase subunit
VQNLIALQGEANTILAEQVKQINEVKKTLKLDDEALAALDKISALKTEMEELEKQKNEINEKVEKHPALKIKDEDIKAAEEKNKKDADALAAEKEKLIKEKEDAGKGLSSGPSKEEVEKAEKALKEAEEAVESAKNDVNNAQSVLNSTPLTIADDPSKPSRRQKQIPNPAHSAAQNNLASAKSKLEAANKDLDKAKEALEAIKNTKTGPSPEEIEKKKNEIDGKIKANEAASSELENNKKEKIKEINSRCDENEDLKTLKAESDRMTSTLYAKKSELEGMNKNKYSESKLATLQEVREETKKALNSDLEQWAKKAKEALSKIPSDLTNNSDKLTKLAHVILMALAKIENKSARDIAEELKIVLSDPAVIGEVKKHKDPIINALSSEIAEKAMSE